MKTNYIFIIFLLIFSSYCSGQVSELIGNSSNNPKMIKSRTLYDEGYELFRSKQFIRALGKLSESISSNPKNLDALSLRAYTYIHLAKNRSYGNSEDMFWNAIHDYRRCIELSPKASHYLNRGIAYYEVGRLIEACTDVKKAKQLGSDEANDKIDQFGCKYF